MDINAVNEELNYPSASRLMKALKARGIPFNKAEIVNLAADDAVRQIQAAAPVAKGKIASDGLDVLWFADLIDFSANPSKDFKYILVVQDVFSRYLWTRPLEDKKQTHVAVGFQSILEEADAVPQILTTDKGTEFKGSFKELLENEDVEFKVKTSLRQIATIDSAIGQFKKGLVRAMRKAGVDNWHQVMGKVTAAHNKTPNEGDYLKGHTPHEARTNEQLQETLKLKNSSYDSSNAYDVNERMMALIAFGYFRVLKNNTATFKRGWHPVWSDEVFKVAKVEFDEVVDTLGKRYFTKTTLPVQRPISNTRASAIEKGGSKQLKDKALKILKPFADMVKQHLGVGEFTLARIRNYLKTLAGFKLAITESRVNQKAPILNMMKTFPTMFEVLNPSTIRVM